MLLVMKITLVTAEHRAAGAAFRGGGVSLGPCMKTGRQGVVEVRGCSRLPCTRERRNGDLMKWRLGRCSPGDGVANCFLSRPLLVGASGEEREGFGSF